MSATPVLNKDRVRIVGFLKKKAGMSKEEFTRRWLEHGKLFRSLDISKVVTKYEQVRTGFFTGLCCPS
jgi:hypothetical protein